MNSIYTLQEVENTEDEMTKKFREVMYSSGISLESYLNKVREKEPCFTQQEFNQIADSLKQSKLSTERIAMLLRFMDITITNTSSMSSGKCKLIGHTTITDVDAEWFFAEEFDMNEINSKVFHNDVKIGNIHTFIDQEKRTKTVTITLLVKDVAVLLGNFVVGIETFNPIIKTIARNYFKAALGDILAIDRIPTSDGIVSSHRFETLASNFERGMNVWIGLHNQLNVVTKELIPSINIYLNKILASFENPNLSSPDLIIVSQRFSEVVDLINTIGFTCPQTQSTIGQIKKIIKKKQDKPKTALEKVTASKARKEKVK